MGIAYLALVAAACGPHTSAIEDEGRELVAHHDPTGIHRLEVDGVNLFEGVGGYYIIGTCDGTDDPGQNVISKGGDGRTLHAPGRCPGAPYSLSVSGSNPLRISVRVGPLPVDYRSISVPLDPTKRVIDRFALSQGRYEVGCGGSWSARSGREASFDSIPQPCHIPGHGPVGAARVRGRLAPGAYGEIAGPRATLRRVIVDTNANQMLFYRHPYTHNVEIGFGAHRAGEVLHLTEELHVLPPRASPPSPTPTVHAATGLVVLYRGLLGREPDPSGTRTYGPSIEAGGRSAMKSVARQLLPSAEFRALDQASSDADTLERLYRGFFGRAVDASGAATFSPMIAQGRLTHVIDALIDSAEMGQVLGRLSPPSSPPSASSPPSSPAPPPTPSAGVDRGTWLLESLYRAVFDRDVDPGGRSTFGPRLVSGQIDAAEGVARDLVASPEFAERTHRVGSAGVLDAMYRGLLGRGVDPTGRASFEPLVDRGEPLVVLQSILRSAELAGRLP